MKHEIIHGFGNVKSTNDSESEYVPNEVVVSRPPNSAQSMTNNNKQGIVLNNGHELRQIHQSSLNQVVNDKSEERKCPKDDAIEIEHYDAEDYSSRKYWRLKNNTDTVLISDDGKETDSDIEKGEISKPNNNAMKKSTMVRRKFNRRRDNGKCSDSNSDVHSECNSDESLPDIPPDSETNSQVSQPYLDGDGNMVLPPLTQQLIADQQGPSLTGWERAADFQILNLLKLMPKADFAANKWQCIACRMQNYTFNNSQVANHVGTILFMSCTVTNFKAII